MVPAITLSPVRLVMPWPSSSEIGPYGAVVVVHTLLTLSSRMPGLATGPTAYGSNPSRRSAP